MAFSIQTNILSLYAQTNLLATQKPLQQAMERLSSGYRINSAADDAAGLAISSIMNTQIIGLNVALRNANDGISVAQTAEGAMNEIVNSLQRIRELATQAMSGQYGTTDVAYMQQEVNTLVEEVGMIAEQTKFNNKRLLGGGVSYKFHVGYAASDAGVTLTLGSLNTDYIGGATYNAAGLDGAIMHLNDIHTATTYAVAGAGDATFISGAGYAHAYSYTASSPIVYSGRASFLVNGAVSGTFTSQASNALAIVDGALSEVLSAQAAMGADVNRFNAISNNLNNVVLNTQDARSQIMDADFAVETANFTKYLILQQAGIAVLSQANLMPLNLLSLLK